jgi:alkylation response protein AidB-like acyl-CoA dehydrogenase
MSRGQDRARNVVTQVDALITAFARRAADYDDNDTFVARNYEELKAARLMGLAVPSELGGDGLDARSVADILRRLARACASTGLAFSMHNQAVAALAWHWRHQRAPVGSILRRIARDQLVVATSNGSDWLNSSGTATRAKTGFRIEARKRVVSGAAASDLLATSAIYCDPIAGPTVLHFVAPMDATQIKVESTWHALGMRGTGSHHISIDGLTVSDRSIVVRRPQGLWHPLYHAAVMIAMPLIFSVYLGIAEAARDEAVTFARARSSVPSTFEHLGTIENHLNTVRIAVEDMFATATIEPDMQTTRRLLMARTMAGDAAIATVQSALEFIGSTAFLKPHLLERLFRDVQAARFHPLIATQQRMLVGRLALGVDPDLGMSAG